MTALWQTCICIFCLAVSATFAQSAPAAQKTEPEVLPTGMTITPTAAPGAIFETLNPNLPNFPDFVAGQAVTTAASPDGNFLLVLTSGYNLMNDAHGLPDRISSNEYVFVYDISSGKPQKKQVLQIPNSFMGLAWNPSGKEFYVSGGGNDNVHVFGEENGKWSEAGPPIAMGHTWGLGVKTKPAVAGLGVNRGGTRLLVANYENDSVSLVDLGTHKKIGELDLRPGKSDPTKRGTPGGEYPFWVIWKGKEKAYVSSQRDREIVVLNLVNGMRVAKRIALRGVPNKMILSKTETRLFVALHSSDRVAVIDTEAERVLEEISTTAPATLFANAKGWKGSSPNSLALSPDERLLLVTNGGANSVAIIALGSQQEKGKRDADDETSGESRVAGLIPTGWYPTSVSASQDGRTLFVVNGFSVPGPVPKNCRAAPRAGREANCRAANQYILQRMKAGLLTVPLPSRNALEKLTRQVVANNHWERLTAATKSPAGVQMSELRKHIKHVIYIVKENRTYDQVLGDLDRGNGDPKLVLFPQAISPNHHSLARTFVTLDNFYASGNVSGDGWNWSTAARASETTVINVPINYAHRNLGYDFEGANRDINVGEPSVAGRRAINPEIPSDPDLLPGTADVAAPDSAEGEAGAGYLWDATRRAGRTLRNYGFFLAPLREEPTHGESGNAPLMEMPFARKQVVAFPTKSALRDVTDPYFRGFNTKLPDFFRFKEWEREFDQYEKDGNLPALTLMRLPNDHFGTFRETLRGVNTVETQMADNDYALGLLVEKISRSRYKNDTLIFSVEDDAQNGPDHVDAHRTIAFVAGAYVKRGAVISQRYNTVNMLRTIEDVLGLEPLGLYDAALEPMAEAFQAAASDWSFRAVVPEVLRTTQLPLPPKVEAKSAGESARINNRKTSDRNGTKERFTVPRHGAEYWEEKTKGLDFLVEDRLDAERFNRALWEGLKGEKIPFPVERDGRNLRRNRARLLRKFRAAPSSAVAAK